MPAMTARPYPKWMPVALALAGLYNLAWAGWMVLLPAESFAASGMMRPGRSLDYPHLWQGIGTLVGVFGLGYLLAATDPVRHWGVVLVGLVSKLVGGAGAVFGVVTETAPPAALVVTAFNDFLWWVPLALIARHGVRKSRGPA